MTLCQAVKLVGGAGRHEKMWRTAATATPTAYSMYGQPAMTRKADEVQARRTIGVQEAAERADAAARYASALRAGIAMANGQEREMEVSAELFE